MQSDRTIDYAKITGLTEDGGYLDCTVVDSFECLTKKQTRMMRLTVSDGVKQALILIWQQDLERQSRKCLKKDAGITLRVDYDEDRNSFTLHRGCIIKALWTKTGAAEYGIGDQV